MPTEINRRTVGGAADILFDSDPSQGGGFAAGIGSTGRTETGEFYIKVGATDTEWDRVQTFSVAASSRTGQWTYNDGSSPVIDSAGSNNLTVTGGTFNVDNWESDGTIGSSWVAPNGAFSSLGDFTLAQWIEFKTVTPNFAHFTTIGDGTGAAAGTFSIICTTRASGTLGCFISDGATIGLVTASGAAPANTKILYTVRYTRAGGVANNTLHVRWSADGITWRDVSDATVELFDQSPSFELRSESQTGSTALPGMRQYGMEIHNKVLSNAEIQAIYDAGSEGDSSPSIPSEQIQYSAVTTTDATVTVADTFITQTDTRTLLTAKVVGRRTGGTSGAASDGLGITKTVVAKNTAGTVTLMETQDDYYDTDISGVDVDFNVSGTGVEVRVTGAASYDITWASQINSLSR